MAFQGLREHAEIDAPARETNAVLLPYAFDSGAQLLALCKAHNLSVAQLAELGVKRISVGSAMALAAYGEFFRAAQEIRDHGTFGFTERSMPFAQANQLFKG